MWRILIKPMKLVMYNVICNEKEIKGSWGLRLNATLAVKNPIFTFDLELGVLFISSYAQNVQIDMIDKYFVIISA